MPRAPIDTAPGHKSCENVPVMMMRTATNHPKHPWHDSNGHDECELRNAMSTDQQLSVHVSNAWHGMANSSESERTESMVNAIHLHQCAQNCEVVWAWVGQVKIIHDT